MLQEKEEDHSAIAADDDDDVANDGDVAKTLKKNTTTTTTTIESLATKCREIIADNINRYPIEFIGSLPEMEWESIVQLKYNKTAPKKNIVTVSVLPLPLSSSRSSNLLSDGRKFPLFNAKFIQDIEERHGHLSTSHIIDELVWKDCVDFKFKRDGPSRPFVFREPWGLQVQRLQGVIDSMEAFHCDLPNKNTNNGYINSNSNSSNSSNSSSAEDKVTLSTISQQQQQQQQQLVKKLYNELKDAPMNVPLLSKTGIGKALKKFIKKLRRNQDQQQQQSVVSYSQVSKQLQLILEKWKEIASANGVVIQSKINSNNGNTQAAASTIQTNNTSTGQNRHTSDEQHAQDIMDIQQCSQWRDLYRVLANREQKLIKSHGAKMRKCRENLKVGRPKIGKTITKRRVGRRVCNPDGGYGGGGGSSNIPTRQLVKLRQDFKQRSIAIKGGKASANRSPTSSNTIRSTFGSSVSSALSGKKRGLDSTHNTATQNQHQHHGRYVRKLNREVVLDGGKKMKLPKLTNSMYQNNLKRRR
jgi:hypothetical protein